MWGSLVDGCHSAQRKQEQEVIIVLRDKIASVGGAWGPECGEREPLRTILGLKTYHIASPLHPDLPVSSLGRAPY